MSLRISKTCKVNSRMWKIHEVQLEIMNTEDNHLGFLLLFFSVAVYLSFKVLITDSVSIMERPVSTFSRTVSMVVFTERKISYLCAPSGGDVGIYIITCIPVYNHWILRFLFALILFFWNFASALVLQCG